MKLSLISILALWIFLGNSVSHATVRAGTEGGNGGGVVCIQGQCHTLVEAGLRMSPMFNGVWIPSNHHYEKVNSLIERGTRVFEVTKREIFFSIFGRGDHFRKVDIVDGAKLEEIKHRYIELTRDAGFNINEDNFEVVAFSSDDTVKPALTYLLPKFFELTEDQQASILLHEGLYRGRPSGFLNLVLQFESSMSELTEDSSLCQKRRVPFRYSTSCIDQQIISHLLGYITRPQLLGALLTSIYESNAPSIEIIGKLEISENAAAWVIDPRQVVALGSIDSRLPYIFSQLQRINLKKLPSEVERRNSVFEVNWNGDPVKPLVIGECRYKYRNPQDTHLNILCMAFEIVDDDNLKFVLPD